MMKNNAEQERAIKSIDKNLSVIAGAGTGKTKVLTERFVYILENGNLPMSREIESIVAITFTKKASQEMIERIRREIRSNFPKGEKWRRYYRDIEKANISTIHSFCLNILKENVIAANLDPMFEVIEEYEARKMLKHSIIEVLNEQIEDDIGLYNLLTRMGKDRPSSLIDEIVSVYNEIRTIAIDIEDIKSMTLDYLNQLKDLEPSDLDKIRSLVMLLIEKGSKTSKISKVLKDSQCRAFLQGEDVEDLDIVLSIIHENIGANKKEQANIDALEEIIEIVLKSLEKENIEYYKSILSVLSKVDLLYKGKKEAFGGLDYEDLQIITDKLLEDKGIREKYQNKYKYIMIDEFQDTNKLQKQIFYKISTRENALDRNNLFVVGDPKQSIYGFRGADLDVFYNVVDDIGSSNHEGSITLNKNYRTINTVINFINNIFIKLMGSDYSALDSHKNSENKIDIEIISNENLSIPEAIGESEFNRHYEAEQIAKRISILVDEGKYKYKDFAMLFRATTRNYIYEKALNKFKVPYYNIGSKGFFQQQEILDTINVLKSLNNIGDKVPTIGFLRSNYIGLNDNTIYYIFAGLKEDGDTNDGILKSIEKLLKSGKLPVDQESKLNAAFHIYKENEKYMDVYGIVQVLENLMEESLFIKTSLLKENGRQKFANLYKFIEIAREYEEKYIGNLNEFLDYIADIRENDESLGEIEGDNTDAVKILTIHKSKGLEFPVVIIPELATKSPNFSDKFLLDENIGISIGLGKSNPTYNNIKNSKTDKEKEETKRVLYVAMTRAEKLLILGNQGKSVGFKKMIEELLEDLEYNLIEEVDMEEKESQAVKMLSEDLIDLKLKAEDKIILKAHLPNLYQISSYNKEFQNRISISKYMVFKECKRKYFLEKHLRISNIDEIGSSMEENDFPSKEDLLSPIEKGLIVHEFCETYRLGMDKKQLVENIVHRRAINYSDEIYSLLEKYIDNYLKDYNEDYQSVYYEKPFFLQLEGAYINGSIDKLIISNGKIIIEDFKTNKLYNKKALVEKYRPQIQLYSYVAREILNLEIKSASILFLENGEKVQIPVDNTSLKNNIDRIQDFIDFTRDNNEIENYKKTSLCSEYCKYNNICNLKEEISWVNI